MSHRTEGNDNSDGRRYGTSLQLLHTLRHGAVYRLLPLRFVVIDQTEQFIRQGLIHLFEYPVLIERELPFLDRRIGQGQIEAGLEIVRIYS